VARLPSQLKTDAASSANLYSTSATSINININITANNNIYVYLDAAALIDYRCRIDTQRLAI
jgi:hypothetical protein